MKKKTNKVKTSSLLTKMNLRTIFHSKLQFIAVILITAIAMTLFVGLTSNAKSINDRVDSLYADSNVADTWITTSISQPQDKHAIEKLVGPKGKVESRFMMPAKLRSSDATALICEELPTINKPARTDNNDEENFFIIDEKLLSFGETKESKYVDEEGNYLTAPIHFSITSYLKIFETTELGEFDGETKTILDALNYCKTTDNDLLTNPYLTMEFQVTGSMVFAENVQSSQMNNTNFLLSRDLFLNSLYDIILANFENPKNVDPSDENYEFATFLRDMNFMAATILAINQFTQDNQYVAKIDPKYDKAVVKERIQDYFELKGENNNLIMATDLDMLPSNFTIQNDIIQAEQLAYIFPIIFFLVAILVVLTTISQIILKDRTQIGTMKALGLSNVKIMMHYMALAVYLVLIGVVLGIIIGPFIIPMIMNQKYDILYTLPPMGYTIAIPEALISTLVVVLITCFVTWLVVKNSVKLNPSQAMRPKEVKSVKKIKNDGKVSKGSIPFKMAFRNIRLNLAKSMMVIIGIAGCTSLLVCGFGIDDTLVKGVKTDEMNFFDADCYVAYNSNDSIIDNLKLENVDKVEEYTTLPTTVNFGDRSFQSFLYAFQDDSYFFNIDNFNLKDKIAISNKVAKELHIKVGDTISFQSVGMNFEGEVGYILECFYMHGVYVNTAYSNYGDVSHIKTNAWINFKKGISEDQISQTMLTLHDVGGVANVKTRKESIDMINSYMSSISLMTLAVKVFAILLAVVVLYNLSLLNFKERTRDIATLKVLGFSKLEISLSLIIESITLTLIGAVLGLLLGLPMEILVLIVNLTPVVEFLYTVYPVSYVISFFLTIGTTMLVNYLLTFKINKVQMVESLKSVE